MRSQPKGLDNRVYNSYEQFTSGVDSLEDARILCTLQVTVHCATSINECREYICLS